MDMHVGKQIKKSRLERKITQAELVALQKIAFALGVRIENLIYDANEVKKDDRRRKN